jgi:hypothetical protein
MGPSALRIEAQRRVGDWALWLGWLVAGMIVGSRLISLLINPSPWVDEAMISLNLRLVPWRDILKPLPMFDQTAPLGFVLMGKAVSDLAGAHFVEAMRGLAAVASLAAAALYFLGLGVARPRIEAALTVGCLMLAPAFVYHGVEIKHYVYEALATVVVLAAGMNAFRANADERSMALFAIGSTLALLLSFPAAFVIVGFGGALFLFLALEPGRSARTLALVAGTGVLLCAIQLCIYFGYSAPSVALQLEAYAGKYAVGHLVFPPLRRADLDGWSAMIWLLMKPYLGAPDIWLKASLGLLGVVGWVRGVTSPSRPTRYLFIASTIAIAAMLAAACLGIFTPKADRHLLFITPLTAPALILGLSTLLEWAANLAPKPLQATGARIALAILVLIYGAHGLAASFNAEREPVGTMLERVKDEGGWPRQTWVYYAGQSSIDLLTYPKTPAYLGRVANASSPKTWFHALHDDYGAYLARFTREASGRRKLYILFSHTAPGEIERFVATAEHAIGPCRLLDRARGTRGEAGVYLCKRAAPPA